MELARPLDASPSEQRSVLAALRLQRKLTIQEAATKAALWPDQVEWLEEGRLYRFPSSEAAVLALLRYATALDIDHREARRLAGLPVEPPPRRPIARWIAVGVAAALLAVLSAALAARVRPRRVDDRREPRLDPGAALARHGRRPERRRRHQLHAPGRDADRLVRIPHRPRHEGRAVRLPAHDDLLRARRRGVRQATRVTARLRRDQRASRRKGPTPNRRRDRARPRATC